MTSYESRLPPPRPFEPQNIILYYRLVIRIYTVNYINMYSTLEENLYSSVICCLKSTVFLIFIKFLCIVMIQNGAYQTSPMLFVRDNNICTGVERRHARYINYKSADGPR
ncbi:unnamed protein product [Chrysodeixis includens]|uniref:Uncharacterized protein n=1 Tax=Chrysodeixis includens TaxID=689277 RepID=A0A9N8KUC5_CHRIL|nr:unnamed protein product [Chrysodeixis includens]